MCILRASSAFTSCEHFLETISLFFHAQTLLGSSFLARPRNRSTSGGLVGIHCSILGFHVWMISRYLEIVAPYLEQCLLVVELLHILMHIPLGYLSTYFDVICIFWFMLYHWGCLVFILSYNFPCHDISPWDSASSSTTFEMESIPSSI